MEGWAWWEVISSTNKINKIVFHDASGEEKQCGILFFFLQCGCNLTISCWKGVIPIAPTQCMGPTLSPTEREREIWNTNQWSPLKVIIWGQTRYPILEGIKLPRHVIGSGKRQKLKRNSILEGACYTHTNQYLSGRPLMWSESPY